MITYLAISSCDVIISQGLGMGFSFFVMSKVNIIGSRMAIHQL
jgi:hypothetical protein